MSDKKIAVIARRHCVSACGDVFLASPNKTIEDGAYVAYHNSHNGFLKLVLDAGVSLAEIRARSPNLEPLEDLAAREARALGPAGTALLLETISRIGAHSPRLIPCAESGHTEVKGGCLIANARVAYWVPTQADYARFGIAVHCVGKFGNAKEVWKDLIGQRDPKKGGSRLIMYGDKIISSPN